jgi:hypothetical protein
MIAITEKGRIRDILRVELLLKTTAASKGRKAL